MTAVQYVPGNRSKLPGSEGAQAKSDPAAPRLLSPALSLAGELPIESRLIGRDPHREHLLAQVQEPPGRVAGLGLPATPAGITVGRAGQCERVPAAADRTRYMVVSHPFDAQGQGAGRFEVLEVSRGGKVSRPNRTFALGSAPSGDIVFTPDGKVGVVPLQGGTLGVFSLDDHGVPTVVHASFAGSFYASRVIMDPRGDRLFVIDANWRENGGGIYMVTLDCDGKLTDRGRIAGAKLPAAITFVGDRALIVAANLDGSSAGHNVHLVDWGNGMTRVDSIAAFGDAGDASTITGGYALTEDGTTFLLGDTNAFSAAPNRVAAIRVTAKGLERAGSVPINDPAAIVTSPFGRVAIVASGFGDAIYVIDENPDHTWRVRGQVPYAGRRSQLPSDLNAIDRGPLRGHVFVVENTSLRHLAFTKDGGVVDLGSFALGTGVDNINGAAGITP